MDSGLAGVVAAETVLSHSDGARGIMWVRGHTLPELAANFGYDGAVGLFMGGLCRRSADPREDAIFTWSRASVPLPGLPTGSTGPSSGRSLKGCG